MKKSLLIANADPSFDFMAQMRKKKNNFGTFGINQHNSFGLNMNLSQKGKSRVSGIRPMPRDGHSCTIYNDMMIGFGGDRHHMPFNDLFVLDISAELEKQSFNLVVNRESHADISMNEESAKAADEVP